MNTSITNTTQELSKEEKQKAWRKAYEEANKEKRAAWDKTYYEANKEKKAAYNKAYQKNNKQKKKYQPQNIDKARARHSKWRKNNPGKSYKTQKERHTKDPTNKVKDLFRSAIYKAFLRIKQNKPTDTQTLLGCTWEEAKARFESLFQEGMNWSNHGEWHVDHIRPVASFGPDELHLMNHISNLQPLWAKDNILKSDSY